MGHCGVIPWASGYMGESVSGAIVLDGRNELTRVIFVEKSREQASITTFDKGI